MILEGSLRGGPRGHTTFDAPQHLRRLPDIRHDSAILLATDHALFCSARTGRNGLPPVVHRVRAVTVHWRIPYLRARLTAQGWCGSSFGTRGVRLCDQPGRTWCHKCEDAARRAGEPPLVLTSGVVI